MAGLAIRRKETLTPSSGNLEKWNWISWRLTNACLDTDVVLHGSISWADVLTKKGDSLLAFSVIDSDPMLCS